MKEKLFGLLAFVLGALLVASIAAAAPAGASVVNGTASSLPESTASSLNISGGQVQEVNVSGYTITNKWAGFFGQVSGDIRLGDSAGNIFYQWTVNDPTGAVVYAVTNGTVSDWSDTNIAPLYGSDTILPSFLTSGADSFNNTFTSQETFTSNSLTINNVNYTTTWESGTQGSNFKTYALKASTEGLMVWAAKAVSDTTGFNGNAVDYQVLVGLTSQTQQVPVYFYLELP